MIFARSAAAGILAMMLTIDVAEAAEPAEPPAVAAPAVVRYFDPQLGGGVLRQPERWEAPVPAWRYRDTSPAYGERRPRRRAYLGPERYRWRSPSWSRPYGLAYPGDFARNGYRYGYGPMPYYGFYDWRPAVPAFRGDRRYGWRSDGRPSLPPHWRR